MTNLPADFKPSPSYLAGFFDGEGSVFVSRIWETGKYERYRRLVIRVKATSRDKYVLDLFQDIFGGRVYQKTGEKEKNYPPCYDWVLTGADNIKRFCLHILDYSLIKHEQLMLALRFLRTMYTQFDGSRRLTAQQKNEREVIRQEFKKYR